MKRLLLISSLVILIAINSYAYTTSNQNLNISIYPVYDAYTSSNSNLNISLEPSQQAYRLAASNLNITFSIFNILFPSEEATTTIAPPTTVGPGGGGPPSTILDFSVTPSILKVLLRPGETIIQNISIRNTGNSQLPQVLIRYSLLRYITIADTSFPLVPGEERIVNVVFTASLEDLPEVYTDIITVQAANIIKRVIAIIEIKKLKPLFDIEVRVDKQYERVLQGQEFPADIILYNFGDLKPVDVNLFYSIRSLDGNDIFFRDKTLAINEQQLVKVNLTVPENIQPGNYLVYGKIIYSNNTEASSSALIEVISAKERFRLTTSVIYIVSSIVLLIIILLIILYIKRRKKYDYKSYYTKLVTEIKIHLAKGYTKAQIKEAALKAGWPPKMVDSALKEA